MFNYLVLLTGAELDRRGENAHITCPACGHESSIRDPHCSFFAKSNGISGWKCFSCGAGGTLRDLAERLRADVRVYNTPARPQKAPQAPPSWLSNPEPLIRSYEAAQGRIANWKSYKPLKDQTIIDSRFGWGVLPASKCHHPRLIVPIFDGTLCVGLRGRWAGCQCDPKKNKWLVAEGTYLSNLPLYGADKLRRGCVVVLVENCVDARLISQETEYVGCAMYSTSYWRDEWAEELRRAKPKLVIVGLDNDLVGNGGAWRRAEFIRIWQEQHKTDKIPEAAGPKRVNRLLELGLPAMLYDWKGAEYKSDFGGLIK